MTKREQQQRKKEEVELLRRAADERRTRVIACSKALAKCDAAYELLHAAKENLKSMQLYHCTAEDRVAEARSCADIARAHVRELLERTPT